MKNTMLHTQVAETNQGGDLVLNNIRQAAKVT
jgi:hypothetical protein